MDVVQSIGEYLIDEDATVRARGMVSRLIGFEEANNRSSAVAYYAGVLAAVDPNFLTRQQSERLKR